MSACAPAVTDVQATAHDATAALDVTTARRAIVALCACGLMVALLQTLVVPLIPQIPTLLSVSPASAAWLLTATLVAGAVSAPVLGRLGDMYGKRRMLLVCLWIILVSAVLAALAPNFTVLLVARALQGVSFGVIALGMSLMRDVLPPAQVGAGVGLMSSSLGVGAAAGPPLAGVIAQLAGWRFLFVVVAVLGLVLVLLVWRLVGESPVRTGGRFDGLGAVGLGVALVCLMLGISKGPEWGWATHAVWGLFAAAVALLVVWGWYELRRPSPLVDLRVSASPAVLWTNVSTVLIGFAIFANAALATQLLQAPVATGYGFGLSMMLTGVVLLPLGVSMVVFSAVSARISRMRGPRTTVLIGSALLVVGNAGVAMLPRSLWVMVAVATVGGIGAALAYSALPLLIMRAVPETETASANSMNTLMRQLGTSTVTAVAAAASAAYVVHVDGHVVPSGTAYSVSFLAAAVAALAAMVIAALTPGPAERSTAPAQR